MFKCLECGHIFEDGEQAIWEERHGLETPPYERRSGCPICRGEYEETKPCKHCGSEHLADELYEGWCEECLREQITYAEFFDYCEADNDAHRLDAFVMSELLGGMDCPEHISYDFHRLMIDVYKSTVENAVSFGEEFYGFLSSCVYWIMDELTEKDNFADWLNGKEVK